ncbi:hypothetical protein PPL_12565 [Heterostelium album PN500]|uniref:Uncharacterized protein n=1 Tax=Heterostelium pallidum (strain ATCC 26659 / Pp 5 / PN500) TaxID=670386 RepID=D3BMZ1_HETP5|nr:hypothetical protein PPL_12565 [Heterostelium album PN500]EFA77353.1 hypothetical protein PPL_12565 [Heterostelium album PN500]|eukprot:XP_020429482.1 hypothetical protein PPL_12565 [Heterostelium album PN500]
MYNDLLLNILALTTANDTLTDSNSTSSSSGEYLPDLPIRMQRLYLLYSSIRIILYFYFSTVSFVQIIYLYAEESTLSLRLILAKFLGRRLMVQLRKMMKSSWGQTHSNVHLRRTILLLSCLLIVTLIIVVKTIFSIFIFKDTFLNQWKLDFVTMIIELVMVAIVMAGVSGSYPSRMYAYRDASKFEEKKSNTGSELSSRSEQTKSKSSSSGSGSKGEKSTVSTLSSTLNSTYLDDSAINSSDNNI